VPNDCRSRGMLDTSTRLGTFSMCDDKVYEYPKIAEIGRNKATQEWNSTRTNVQLFHLRVEGRAFHSQSIGCTRSTTYHSARLPQSLKD
jgi:hypothetical protein